MGFRIFEISNKFRVLVSADPALVLNRRFDMYEYTGVGNANWMVPPIAGSINYMKVKNRSAAGLLTLIPFTGTTDQLWDIAPVNSFLVLPTLGYTLINDKFFWLVTA